MVQKFGFAVLLFAATGAAYGQQQAAVPSAAGGWQMIVESHDNDYSIICSRGKDNVIYRVAPNNQNLEYRVARDVWIKYGADGRPGSISFTRGFTGGDHHDVVTLGSDATCVIEKQ